MLKIYVEKLINKKLIFTYSFFITSYNMLDRFYNTDYKYEICIDEAGRGCLFGRVYIASVVLPK